MQTRLLDGLSGLWLEQGVGRMDRNYGGQSEVAPLQSVLLKQPWDAYGNPGAIEAQWEALNYLRAPDLRGAMEEHEALRSLLEGFGARVEYLPSHEDTGMDSIYARDAALMTDAGAVLCNMGKVARSAEPVAQTAAYEGLGIPVLGEISGNGTLEGGDFLWLDEKTAVVGRGYRTNDEGIRQLRDLLSEVSDELMVVPLPHWQGPSDVFHLMSIISPIDTDLALVYSPLMPVPFREALLDRGITLVEVPTEEFDSMGGNVLALAPRVCLALEGNPVTRRRLEEAGAEVHTYKGEEISAPGCGGPTCLTRPLVREG
jgi:N-dimethylarginine dimethylaminohydrolase